MSNATELEVLRAEAREQCRMCKGTGWYEGPSHGFRFLETGPCRCCDAKGYLTWKQRFEDLKKEVRALLVRELKAAFRAGEMIVNPTPEESHACLIADLDLGDISREVFEELGGTEVWQRNHDAAKRRGEYQAKEGCE